MASDGINEMDGLLNVISEGNSGRSWKENTDVALYLAELSSFEIQRLTQEPERLAEEKNYILDQTQELAFHNYKTFIQAAECSKEIFQDFNLMEKRLDSLFDKVPQFHKKCKEFTETAQNINERWRQSSLTLSKHPQLLEILEIPQLMDTCVRNAYYEEALELAAYVARLDKKYSSIQLVHNIATEVQESQRLMLGQLLQQLRMDIKLPSCLKVIGYLRRMNIFTEAQLRITFLQARDSWFKGLLANIPSSDVHSHISKTIELSRVHLFDIITQYRAIFSDDDQLLIPGMQNPYSETNIFHSWLNLKVTEFLTTLERDISQDMGSRLDSVLAQSMYFGLSFSRIGADFRTLLAPIFQRAVLNNLRSRVKEATGRFQNAMEAYTLTNVTSMSSVAMLTSSLTTEGNLQPPLGLLDFFPLALYANNILTSFNELRLCCPVPLAPEVVGTLADSLSALVTTILDFYSTEEKALTEIEQESFNQFCVQFAYELIPYLNKCLALLFPPLQLAKILGINAAELHKLGSIAQLDANAILERMNHFLVSRDEEDEGITLNVHQQPSDEKPIEAEVPSEEQVAVDSDTQNIA